MIASIVGTTASPSFYNEKEDVRRWRICTLLMEDKWPSEQPICFDGSGLIGNSLNAALGMFLYSLRRNGKVQSLDFKNITLDLKSQAMLKDVLSSGMNQIRRLELWNVSTDSPHGCLDSSFFLSSSIEDLTLVRCKLNKESSSLIGKKMLSGSLNKLKLAKMELINDSVVMELLINGIVEGSIRELELRDIRADQRILSKLLQGLATNVNLEKLCLHQCGIDSSCAEDMSVLLAKNQFLRSLNLCSNDLNGSDIGIITELGLQHNHSLKSLTLSHNPVGDDGAQHLRDLLTTNPTLESLVLLDCDIWNPGCIRFLEGLPKMQGLKRLTVDSEWENHAELLLNVMQSNMSLIEFWSDRSALWMVKDAQWKKIAFYLHLNQAKRRILIEPSVSSSMWPHVLAQSNHNATILYHFLSHKPDLIPTHTK
eukprot:scaffold3827_cov179-Cylindrotheca_fusiformis.AAC.15